MQTVKDVLQLLSSLVVLIAAPMAVLTYYRSRKLERAKWALQLYEKFYEHPTYKKVRDMLDCGKNEASAAKLVRDCPAEFTDYLNFFEFIALLQEQGQIKREDADALFKYYRDCLKQHDAVREYIKKRDHGYEALAALIAR